MSYAAVDRHKQSGHAAEALAVYAEERKPFQIDTAAIFHRNVQRLGKAQDAADEWLTDPERPEKYDLSARSYEVKVIYLDHRDCNAQGEPRRKKADLQELIERAEKGGVTIERAETKFSDPRDYLLKSSSELRGELTLFMQSLALMEEKRQRELAEQRASQQEAESVEEMFEARLPLIVDELTAGLVAEGADEARARTAAEKLAKRILPALTESFQGE